MKKEPSVPSVKSQLAPDMWAKKVESPNYRRKIARFVRLLKEINPLARHLSREHREIAHYFLDGMTFEETRRQRSPAERVADTLKDNAAPTTSQKY